MDEYWHCSSTRRITAVFADAGATMLMFAIHVKIPLSFSPPAYIGCATNTLIRCGNIGLAKMKCTEVTGHWFAREGEKQIWTRVQQQLPTTCIACNEARPTHPRGFWTTMLRRRWSATLSMRGRARTMPSLIIHHSVSESIEPPWPVLSIYCKMRIPRKIFRMGVRTW